jgi:hypothetical protein
MEAKKNVRKNNLSNLRSGCAHLRGKKTILHVIREGCEEILFHFINVNTLLLGIKLIHVKLHMANS